MVSRTAPQLVKAVYSGLEPRISAMRGYTDLQRQYTAEDLAHVVDFLATALYTGDGALFTDFLRWTGEILASRGVPAASLVPALDLLSAELRDFPRATGFLTEAREDLVTVLVPRTSPHPASADPVAREP
ncbi:cobalamin-binding protein [Amycolatopsis sp. NPDC051903]|uniref:cobalamin-binding protein n=1 Tax=Amycolatopsis sp. NPDC051903 TaxID=3363936 RepID=UPI0037B1CAC0